MTLIAKSLIMSSNLTNKKSPGTAIPRGDCKTALTETQSQRCKGSDFFRIEHQK